MASPLLSEDAGPPAAMSPVVDDHFGTTVVDHYRFLENLDHPDVRSWMRRQADSTTAIAGRLPGRRRLLERIGELDAGTPFTVSHPQRLASGDIFFLKRASDENVARLWMRAAGTGAESVLIDPDQLPKPSPDQHVAIDCFAAAPDGRHVLYIHAADGSEQRSLRVLDRLANTHLPETIDRIESVYSPPFWRDDGGAFVYSQIRPIDDDQPEADCYRFTQARLHALGTDPAGDPFVFGSLSAGSPPLEPLDFPSVTITPGSPWAIGQVRHGDEADLTLYAAPVARLGAADIAWRKVCDRSDAVRAFAVFGDDIFLVSTAARHAVVRVSLAAPDAAPPETVFAPEHMVVESVVAARDAIYIEAIDHATRRIVRLAHGTAAATVLPTPPDEPSASIVAARADVPGILMRTQSWIRAGGLHRFDPVTGRVMDVALMPAGRFDTPDWLAATEAIVVSHDGAKVPLSIIHRADLLLDGSHPTLLDGYGSYGFTFPMSFFPARLAWLERGGVIAVAHVRGGGTFGRAWHHAGRGPTKPNTWKDFIACAEYLVARGYTSVQGLCGQGRSAGGILIGRAVTERPDLFAAAHIGVGCTDMIRFETTKNGPPNIPEFGGLTNEEGFRGLLAMSTLHHVHDGVAYPAILLTHGINDPRVAAWQSAKTAARFQAATASGRPVLLRIDYHAGHGNGSTLRQKHEELADVWSFFLWQCGDPDFQPAFGGGVPASICERAAIEGKV